VVSPSVGLFHVERQRIVQFALSQRWPVIGPTDQFAVGGALLSYSADTSGHYRRAAHYVDRILKGAKPADLPIEQPMRFNFVVNLKTAKALGLDDAAREWCRRRE
jgi:putative ABC transport system substrate-binding protein